MKEILKKSRELFKTGDYFTSASGLLATPIKVSTLKISDNYPNMIVNSDNGGIIAIVEEDGEIMWAKKV